MPSNERILEIFTSMLTGDRFTKIDLENYYNVNTRTIQRDLAIIKNIIDSTDANLELVYNSPSKTYHLTNSNAINPKEVLAITKILLESRALNSKEMSKIINHLLNTLALENSKEIKQIIANELSLFQPLSHQKDLVDYLWTFSSYISKQTVISFNYQKSSGEQVLRKALPVSLFFSEYYFYILCYNPKYKNYLSYRLDRFLCIESTTEKIKIPYKDRLQDGELRKKIHFMYAGAEVTFTFQFWGIIEAALDKLPNSKVIKYLEDHSVIIKAIAYDTGVIMWLLSQGSKVKVLSPSSFVEKMKKEIMVMNKHYID